MIRFVFLLAFGFASQAAAQELPLPGGTVTRVETSPAASVRLPTRAWSPGETTPETEGAIRRSAYQLDGSTRTTLQLIEPARTTLESDGYVQLFSCADAACGGFDFRFQLDLLPEPDMHVDLGDFRYVLMQKDGANPHTVSLVSSASPSAGFLHVTEVSDAVFDAAEASNTPTAQPAPSPDDLLAGLEANGHAVLADLEFNTGSADLGDGPFASLALLAAWLDVNPTARVVLVGHTDAVGSLDANTSLSRRRAAAVADRLVVNFGANPGQLQSAGAGYLAPVASNLTEEGRATNRRVEVVLLSLE